jgi:hypothetical protein
MEDAISVQYHNQCRLNKDVLVWDAQIMPESWMGSTILEIRSVPYQLIKKDNYATLEQVGKWMRCRLNVSSEWEDEVLQEEYERILAWIGTPDHAQHVPNHAQHVPNHAQHVPNHAQHVPNHAQHVPNHAQQKTPYVAPVFSPTHYPYSNPMMKKIVSDFHETKKRL